jgi:hypothetical protein
MTRTVTIVLLLTVLVAVGCSGPSAHRGGEGTDKPEMDKPAMSVGLDKKDIDYMVGIYTKKLFASPFWIRDVSGKPSNPRFAIWPISNATSQHLDAEMLMLLSSIETTLVNSGDALVVARSAQQDLIKELGIQQGAAYDPATAGRIGKQLGVQYFVTGKLTAVDERLSDTRRLQYTLFLQVLELETGAVKFQESASRSKTLEK